jgi:hypothetical protein
MRSLLILFCLLPSLADNSFAQAVWAIALTPPACAAIHAVQCVHRSKISCRHNG